MSNTRSLFPGAMGPDGFISCFDHLLEDTMLRRRIILKGGPGVGKSTFMRRVHAALCENGEPATLFFCSGDPDSLDAVAVPQKGLVIMDGTAPHIVDPQIPGAQDSIVNLGAYLDEPAMRPRLPHIKSVMADHAACMRRAGACLAAARPLLADNAAIVAAAMDERRLHHMTQALLLSALGSARQSDAPPRVRPVITDAVTHKGELSLITQSAQPHVIRITCHAEADLSPVLMAVSRAAQANGHSAEEHLNPLLPGGLMHLSVPEIGLLITTSDLLPSEQTFDFSACLSQGALLRHECMLEQGHAAIRQHIAHAVQALKSAKQLHDELESFYVPNMDFTRWQSALDEILASLK